MKLETNFINPFKGKLKKLDNDSRNNVYVFLLCLGISVLIWFLIVLSKQSATTLEYRINFVDYPEDMILINKPDSVLVFRIESGGFELFTLKYLSRRRPIELSLRNLDVKKQNGMYAASFPTSQLLADILKDHRFSEELVSISPGTVYFKFDPLEMKMVPVIPDLNLTFEKQYRLKDSLIIIPDSVKIVGSANQLQIISEVKTKPYSIDVVKKDGNLKCLLVKPDFGARLAIIPQEAEIYYRVEKYTESTIEIPIVDSEGVNTRFFPATTKVTFLVSLDDFSRVNKNMFKAEAVIPSDRSINNVQVEITIAPSFVNVIRISPSQAEYLILKE